jgi:predicted ArsR family transcriptional regulator
MIRRLLVLLDQGSMTFGRVAQEMGLSEAELRGRMEMMVRMGHLESVPLNGDSLDPGVNCPGCLLSGRCLTDSCSDGVPTVGFRLTEKGRRLARKDLGDEEVTG